MNYTTSLLTSVQVFDLLYINISWIRIR